MFAYVLKKLSKKTFLMLKSFCLYCFKKLNQFISAVTNDTKNLSQQKLICSKFKKKDNLT